MREREEEEGMVDEIWGVDASVKVVWNSLGRGGDGLDVRTRVLEEGCRRERKASVSSGRQHSCVKRRTDVRTTVNAQVAAVRSGIMQKTQAKDESLRLINHQGPPSYSSSQGGLEEGLVIDPLAHINLKRARMHSSHAIAWNIPPTSYSDIAAFVGNYLPAY